MFRMLPILCLLIISGSALAQTESSDEGWDDPSTSDEAGFGDDTPPKAGGDDEAGWGDDDTGFDNAGFADVIGTASVSQEKPRYFTISGTLRTDNAIWLERFDDNPFAKARQNLDLGISFKRGKVRAVGEVHLEYDLAYLVERKSYDRPTLNAYELQVEPREVYAAVGLGPFDLTVGRQVIAWGTGDVISPTDVVNPRDNREPGLADLDDLRIPVLATRLGLYAGSHKFEAMVVHEAFFGFRTPPLGPFSPLPAILGPMVTPALEGRTVRYVDQPGRFISNAQQLFFRWTYSGVGADVNVYLASVLLKDGVILLPDPMVLGGTGPIDLTLNHPRYTMIGQSSAFVVGEFLIHWELGLDLARQINAAGRDAMAIGVEEHNVFNAMFGMTYSGITDLTLALEIGQSLIADGRPKSQGAPIMVGDPVVVIGAAPQPLFPLDEPVYSLRALYSFFRQRMQFSGALTTFGVRAQLGWLMRAELAYSLRDALQVSLGYITYQPSDEPGFLIGLEKHDRIFAKLRWDFVLE
jgi:hypothetical protein